LKKPASCHGAKPRQLQNSAQTGMIARMLSLFYSTIRYGRVVLLIGALLYLAGCATVSTRDGAPNYDVDVSKIPNAIPRVEPKSKYGNIPCYEVRHTTYHVMKSSSGYEATGIASWYGTKFHGVKTSSGEPYNMLAMTAAHRTLPLPTYLEVTNLENGRQVVVRVNDRGPFEKNRLIDLSYVAAKKLGITGRGTGLVKVVAIDPGRYQPIAAVDQKVVVHAGARLIYLQLGAFSSLQNAERLQQRIQSCLHLSTTDCRIEKGFSQDRTVYRVKMGPFKTVDASDAMSAKIIAAGFSEPEAVVV